VHGGVVGQPQYLQGAVDGGEVEDLEGHPPHVGIRPADRPPLIAVSASRVITA
jgi:hypothetical protein